MVLLCESEVEPSEKTAFETVVEADIERTALLAKQEELQQADELDVKILEKLDNRLDEIDSQDAETRAGIILSGLGFTTEMQQMKCKEFSGGWRMRIALS